MAVTITEQARRIAGYGADKMTERGYTYRPAPEQRFLPEERRSVFQVVKPGGEARYTVNAHTGSCNCSFHKDNGICKHVLWLRVELAYEAALAARCEDIEEWNGYGRFALADAKY